MAAVGTESVVLHAREAANVHPYKEGSMILLAV
jgi:hypothetical protein